MSNEHKNHTGWDVIIVGGGPAGMMAAGRAAELGKHVLLLEKNPGLGAKLLITGGGRSNITNNMTDVRAFLGRFPESAKFLYSPFSQFGVTETLDFFHEHGMPTKQEAEGRVFPATEKAATVQETLIAYMREYDVTVRTNARVEGFEVEESDVRGVRLAGGEILRARSFVLATGGLSHPETGSTGDGFRFMEAIGCRVQKQGAILVPIRTKEVWTHAFSGIAFPEAKVTITRDGAKQYARAGKLLFTHFGLSGPLILNMSKMIGDLLPEGRITLLVDLFPSHDPGSLDRMIRDLVDSSPRKQIGKILSEILPRALAEALPGQCDLNPNTPANELGKSERMKLAQFAKAIPLTPTGLLGANNAIVTAGGVPLADVDTRTMSSRHYPNLFLVGDVLDVNRPSGGFSLQLCWTTGWVAGSHA
jgi:predicted Rossmann fold flavoprotein